MKTNMYLVNAFVFLIVAIVHLTRVLLEWSLNLGPFQIPTWASGVAVVGLFILAYFNLNAMRE